MKKEEITAKLYRQQFSVEASKRYHAHRIDTLVWCSGALQLVELVASTAALISTFAWSMTVTRGLIFFAGISAGLALVKRTQSGIRFHYEMKAAFGDLAILFPVDLEAGTKEQLEAIEHERQKIEKVDTRGFPCLDVICHNEVCLSLGREEEMKPLTWVQRYLGPILPIPYNPSYKAIREVQK